MTEAYDGRQVVGMDLHRRRSVLVRMTEDGRRLGTARITSSPAALRAEIARAGANPRVVLGATYGWYWAADVLEAAGARVHLAHPLGVRAFACRRVQDDVRDARDLADLLRMGRLAEARGRPAGGPGAPRDHPVPAGAGRAADPAARDRVHVVPDGLGVPVTCTGLFGVGGSGWLDGLRLPQPYAGKVCSLRQLTGGLDAEVTMLTQVTADLLAVRSGSYRVLGRGSGTGRAWPGYRKQAGRWR